MVSKKVKSFSAVIVVAFAVGIVFLLMDFGVFSLFDALFQDKLFIQENLSGQVVIIGIDDKSIQQYGEWPWMRDKHADMIEKLEQSGAKVIGYDVTFSERGQGDEALLQTLGKYNNLVFPMEGQIIVSENEKPKFKSVLWPINEIRQGAFVGHVNFVLDSDGKIRRTANYVKYNDLNIAPFFVGVLQKGGYWQEENDLFPSLYDFDKYGLFRIRFLGPEQTFKYYSFADVMQSDFDAGILNNKIVLVGAVASDLHDEFYTASTRTSAMSGVEVQANLIDGYLQQKTIREINNIFYYLILFVVLGIAGGLIVFRTNWYYSLPLLIALIVLYLIGVALAFAFEYLISILYPLLLIIIIFAFGYLVKYLFESQEKKKIRAGFSQYVAKEVVDELIAHPEKLNLGGERRELTILFSDIRGFTGLSEKMKPEELVNYLNDYLTEMTGVIMQTRGVVDKFIGDAIMAFWNSPLDNENHRQDGLRTAILMQRCLKLFNIKMKQRGEPEIEIGIGLNSGEVVVGNLGSRERFDYTAIGDDVNLASRLESLTKYYGVGILASEKTVLPAKAGFAIRYLDTVAVKGKQTGVRVYQVLGFVEDKKQFADLIEEFEAATELYLNQKWPEAIAAFEKLQKKYPDDRPIEMYLTRIREYQEKPPENFDGVFRASFK